MSTIAPAPAIATTQPEPAATARPRWGLLSDYAQLLKLRVTGMVVLTAWAGYYLGCSRAGIPCFGWNLLAALFGIGVVSGGAAALNQVIENHPDSLMLRTQRRPVASGRMGKVHGALAGLFAIAFGSIFLAVTTNFATGLLTLLTAFGYVGIYTPLKRVSTLATFIGAFPGAMPPLLGWMAARNALEWQAVTLFAILFFWQFPHFLAIAWLYREDYARADIHMLPVVEPNGRSTARQALIYAILLLPISLFPSFLGMAGRIYLFSALLLGLGYLAMTIRFGKITAAPESAEARKLARQLLQTSVLYLPLLMAVMMCNARGW